MSRDAKKIAIDTGLERLYQSPEPEPTPLNTQPPPQPPSPSHSEDALYKEHRDEILASSDTWYLNVEFLPHDMLVEHNIASIPSDTDFLDRISEWMTKMEEVYTVKKQLEEAQQTIADMKAKQTESSNTIETLKAEMTQKKRLPHTSHNNMRQLQQLIQINDMSSKLARRN